MILFVVTETEEKYRGGAGSHGVKMKLEDRARDRCLVLHYRQLSRKLLGEVRPWAICHSGTGTPFEDYDVLEHRGYRWAIRSFDCAQIGFCGGHQIIAAQFGSDVAPMRPVGADEPDLNPAYHPGHFKQWGVYPVRIVRRDPLFRGLGETIRVQEYHRSEVKRLGRDLVLLASSTDCRVQAFVHRSRPVYGTQFHPEASPESYPDGLKILSNFFRIARAYAKARREAR